MDILKKLSQAVWDFLMDYAEYRAECVRRRGISMHY